MEVEGIVSSNGGVRACVPGGAGFIGSWLVKKLLDRGLKVHATLRDTGLPSVQVHSDKLGELGFRYTYGLEEILDGNIDCAVRFASLNESKLIICKDD